MKKSYIFIFATSLFFFSSCGPSEKAEKMADEACQAMSKYNEEDPSTFKDAAAGLGKLISQEGEYKDVGEAEFKTAMEKKCPDGYKKLMNMVDKNK